MGHPVIDGFKVMTKLTHQITQCKGSLLSVLKAPDGLLVRLILCGHSGTPVVTRRVTLSLLVAGTHYTMRQGQFIFGDVCPYVEHLYSHRVFIPVISCFETSLSRRAGDFSLSLILIKQSSLPIWTAALYSIGKLSIFHLKIIQHSLSTYFLTAGLCTFQSDNTLPHFEGELGS